MTLKLDKNILIEKKTSPDYSTERKENDFIKLYKKTSSKTPLLKKMEFYDHFDTLKKFCQPMYNMHKFVDKMH